MSTERLLDGLAEQGTTSSPSTVTLHRDRSVPTAVALGRETILVLPSNGRILAPQPAEARAFFRKVTEWHRWLGNRDHGRMMTGPANLAFVFLIVSGLTLWFPRRWSWPSIRAVLWFRGGLAGKARDFNWHNTAGFWACVPLFFIAVSGVVMSYSWANELVYTMNGVKAPVRGKGVPPRAPRTASWVNLDPLVAQAKRHNPEWKTITFALPATESAPVTFSIDAGNGGQPQYRTSLTLARSGELQRREAFGDQDAGRRARSWMRFVHTGEYYGIAGQTIAGLASLAGALLVWTGFALAFRRFRSRKARTQREAASQTQARIAA